MHSQVFDGQKRPVVFVLPGTEANWADVGKQLQKLHVFNESIERSAITLQKNGYNLHSVLKTTDPVSLQDPFVYVVATTVIQVRYKYIRAFDGINILYIFLISMS